MAWRGREFLAHLPARGGHRMSPALLMTVEWADGRKKSVLDYGQAGPPDLFAPQRLIDSIADEIQWQPSAR